MLTHHIRHLPESALARQVYDEQVENGWPGLAKEAKEICLRLKIEDVNKTNFSKEEFKVIVNKAVKKEDTQWIRNEMEGKKKTKDLVTEDCKT